MDEPYDIWEVAAQFCVASGTFLVSAVFTYRNINTVDQHASPLLVSDLPTVDNFVNFSFQSKLIVE
ncbi:hypothetical protein [Vibrio sp. PID23_8]|uniref:hypothetical protein n=1 Tax=Vibrio sp. PID23_8 TaxID=1583767 RepID=UPI000EF1067C|nr:hypothetical protein [Vibrio sp. PID23_8]RIZ53320.1 hypothetical protein AK966_13920 [Vibrio sp. PID23_8]